MAKRRFIVTTEFKAWQPGSRDSAESYLPMRKGFDLFAEIEATGEFIIFDMDAREFETGRETFLSSTTRHSPDKREDVLQEPPGENTAEDTPNPGGGIKEGVRPNDSPNPHHPKAFVSHSTQDRSFVESFAADLRQHGVDAWYSGWEIKPGDSIRAKIEEGLEDCEYFIIVLSKSSIHRPWVQAELDAATIRKLNGKVRKIIPVKIEDCGDLPPTLGSLCWEDFSNQPYDLALNRILHSIFDTTNKPPIGLPPTKAKVTPGFPIYGEDVGAFARELRSEGFDARRIVLFDEQIGLMVGPKGLDPQRMPPGEEMLFFPLWELNYEANRPLVAARRFHEIVEHRPPEYRPDQPYKINVGQWDRNGPDAK